MSGGLLKFAALRGELVLGHVAILLLLIDPLAKFLQRLVLLSKGRLNLGDHRVAGHLRLFDVVGQLVDLCLEFGGLPASVLQLVVEPTWLDDLVFPVGVRGIQRHSKAHEHQAHDEDSENKDFANNIHALTTGRCCEVDRPMRPP